MNHMTAHCVSTVTGDSLLGADVAAETLELARRFNMLELDGGASYAGKVNFASASDAFDFDTAEPTANSWQFTIKDISDTGLATARVLIYLHDGTVTVGPDNVSTILPANWKARERYFNSPSEAIEYLTTIEEDREAFNRQNSEACRNALAIYARRSNWKAGCLPFVTKTVAEVLTPPLIADVEEIIRFFHNTDQEGEETKAALFTVLITEGYTLSEAVESATAVLGA